MAIRTFNSVGGFSVGDTPTTVILANGDITTSNANIINNMAAGNVKTDHLLYANGEPWTIGSQAGGDANGQIQYYASGSLGANAQFVWDNANSNLNISGNAYANYFIGDVNAGNINVTGRVTSTLLPSTNDLYSLGNSTLRWGNVFASNIHYGSGTAYINGSANVVYTEAANVANNISAGTITSRGDALLQANVAISGNLTVSGNTTYINVDNLDVVDPLISLGGSGNGANSITYDGKDRGLILHNNYPNNLAVNQALIWSTANSEFQVLGTVSSFAGEIVAGTLGNIKASNFVGNLAGFVSANQYLITTVGTLGNLSVTNNITSANANITSVLIASGLTYPTTDGTVGQVLKTNGSGVLSFTTVDTDKITNGSSNVVVYNNGNVTTSVNGTANVLKVTTSGINVLGNTTSGNLSVTGTATVGNVVVGNSQIKSYGITTTTTASNQIIVSVDLTNVRGVIFDVTAVQDNSPGLNKYSIATVTALHDGTNVDFAVYGTVLINGATGTLSCNVSSGSLNLLVSPTSSASTLWTTQYRTL